MLGDFFGRKSKHADVYNKPFWHLSKSAYSYSWFTCKQTIERAESAVKKSKMDSTA